VAEETLIKLLKISIVIGFCLILLGIYFHNYSETIDSLGITGIIISATCIAFGLVFSLPTKMYLTFLLVKRETDLKSSKCVVDKRDIDSNISSDIQAKK
jgi:hypothetical protein